MAYFANYALWNYFTFPRLLLNEQIHWEEIRPGSLRATFPDTIPTHSQIQSFHFDPATGLLRQHDYTVDIISSLATPANVVKDHQQQNGFLFPMSRVVTPRTGKGKVLKTPVLIAITVHRLSVKQAKDRNASTIVEAFAGTGAQPVRRLARITERHLLVLTAVLTVLVPARTG